MVSSDKLNALKIMLWLNKDLDKNKYLRPISIRVRAAKRKSYCRNKKKCGKLLKKGNKRVEIFYGHIGFGLYKDVYYFCLPCGLKVIKKLKERINKIIKIIKKITN